MPWDASPIRRALAEEREERRGGRSVREVKGVREDLRRADISALGHFRDGLS